MNATAIVPNQTDRFHVALPRLRLPVVRGVIDRRILVNFRCDPAVLARLLPIPFRPKLVRGCGMAGICLIRLRDIRPALVPALLGAASENAAHRIAVEWDEDGEVRQGVFIPRRDTSSVLNRLAGGRLFPGVHHAAEFRVWETGSRFKLEMRSADGTAFVRVLARVADELPPDSVFRTIDEASAFFQSGALGWSACPRSGEFDGLELRCAEWRMEPLVVEHVESSFFANHELFPAGSAEFDSAFLVRGLAHEWRARGKMVTALKREPS